MSIQAMDARNFDNQFSGPMASESLAFPPPTSSGVPQLPPLIPSRSPRPFKPHDELVTIHENGEKYPQFIEGKYNMKKKGTVILARGKTSTLRLSPNPTSGTFAVGVVHGSPDYFTDKIVQLQNRTPKGIHPKKKDFTRGDEPVFSIWTDRTAKTTITYLDLNVGKYKSVKMAIVHLASERDMYLNFNTESTALCLESMGQMWNLVVLQLTETEANYEAGFRELDKMEEQKIPIKIVSVLRRNAVPPYSKNSAESSLHQIVAKEIADMNQFELHQVYHFIASIKSRRMQSPVSSNE